MNADKEAMRIVLAALRTQLPSPTGLTRPEMAVLHRLRHSACHFSRGENLFLQGRRHDGIFLLMKGYALRYRILRDGRKQALDVCIPGDTIGGPSCFLGAALNTATALADTAVAFLGSTQIVAAFDRFPRLTLALFRSANAEAARIGEHLIDVGRRGVCERVAHFVLELCTRLETVGLGSRDAFTMPITQVQLADILGLSVPHINRVLRRLREQRLLEITGSRFCIRDRRGLADLADFTDSYLGLRLHAHTTVQPTRAPMRSELGKEVLFQPNVNSARISGHTV